MAPANKPPTTTFTQNTRAPLCRRVSSASYDVRHGLSVLLLPVVSWQPRFVVSRVQEKPAKGSKLVSEVTGTRVGCCMGRGSHRIAALVGAAVLGAIGLVGTVGSTFAAADVPKVDPTTFPNSLPGA